MPLFKRRSSLLEVQNRALIKTAKERTARIDELEREVQILRERAEQTNAERTNKGDRELKTFRETVEHETGKLRRELQTFREGVEQANKLERELQQARAEIERLTLERDFYSKKASALEEENRQLTESATKYSLRAQKLERELTEVATKYSLRAQKLERELTEVATRYSQWGQKLERELARIDPAGAPGRRFGAQDES